MSYFERFEFEFDFVTINETQANTFNDVYTEMCFNLNQPAGKHFRCKSSWRLFCVMYRTIQENVFNKYLKSVSS